MAQDTQAQLTAAIEAARRGERATAQRLLQNVVREDPNNAAAWMWMASTATDTASKRRYLRRVLELEPGNSTARAALQQLGDDVPAAASDGTSRRNLLTFLGVVILLVGLIGAGVAIFNTITTSNTNASFTQAAAVSTQAIEQTQAAVTPTLEFTLTPSVTATFAGNIVTLAPATLPPTFTPTDAPPTATPPPPTATPPPLNDYTLYYISFGDEDDLPTLYSIGANGTDQTSLDTQAEAVAISPDGEQMALLRPSEDEEASPGVVEIFIAPIDAPADAEQLTRLDTNSLTVPVWSPDGEQLLYVRDQTELESIRVNDADSTTSYLSGEETGTKTHPAWSPSGEQLLFSSDFETPGLPEIYAYDIDAEEIQRLTNDAGSSLSPAYSPDGEQIAFISDRNGDSDLYVMQADGSSPLLLTVDDSGASDRDPAWSADGRWIAFSSNRDSGIEQIYLTNPDGLDLRPVTDDERSSFSPSFIP